jgi:hypothetical protein
MNGRRASLSAPAPLEKRMTSLTFRAGTASLAALGLLSILLAGCGGDQPVSPYAGRYRGTGALDSGKPGTLDFTVNLDNSADGTLTAGNPTNANPSLFVFDVNTFGVRGSVNKLTGDYSRSGTVAGQGPFTVFGVLPAANASTAYTVTAGGQTFTGTLTRFGSTGGGTGSTSRRLTIAISNANGFNGQAAAVTLPQITGTVTTVGGVTTFTAVYGTSTAGLTRRLEITATTTAAFAAGTQIPLSSTGSGSLVYTEIVSDGATQTALRQWAALNGSLAVETVTGSSVTFRLVNASMRVDPVGGQTNSATGTFTLNGTGNSAPAPAT